MTNRCSGLFLCMASQLTTRAVLLNETKEQILTSLGLKNVKSPFVKVYRCELLECILSDIRMIFPVNDTRISPYVDPQEPSSFRCAFHILTSFHQLKQDDIIYQQHSSIHQNLYEYNLRIQYFSCLHCLECRRSDWLTG
ncbi:uncharacterized protein LOC118768214 [Octopus sinensis]|uniref:Uncharacterized protein LOC118768214 n=1 Tax=Octopus sinensis TaxID=2607531 RepID=A0A7E6FTP7_9MOLL|nr:uncharacterized protein LOC118768214 [Octopus sinensis]